MYEFNSVILPGAKPIEAIGVDVWNAYEIVEHKYSPYFTTITQILWAMMQFDESGILSEYKHYYHQDDRQVLVND